MEITIVPQELTGWAPIIISIAGVAVAMFTACALIYNDYRQRKHARLSVRPLVTIIAMSPGGEKKRINFSRESWTRSSIDFDYTLVSCR